VGTLRSSTSMTGWLRWANCAGCCVPMARWCCHASIPRATGCAMAAATLTPGPSRRRGARAGGCGTGWRRWRENPQGDLRRGLLFERLL